MKLAKNHLDLGLFTNAREAQLDFWQNTVGLAFDHIGKLGGGVHQLRHHVNGSILKINHARDALPEHPGSGLHRLLIAREGVKTHQELVDPDGNLVSLVAPGSDGIVGIGIELRVNDVTRSMVFYRDTLGYEAVGPDRVRGGDTVILLIPSEAHIAPPEYVGKGYRYTTVQIFDCDEAHARILAAGGEEGRPPRTIGTTTRYSFVRDPDGNWIEISERFELTKTELTKTGPAD